MQADLEHPADRLDLICFLACACCPLAQSVIRSRLDKSLETHVEDG